MENIEDRLKKFRLRKRRENKLKLIKNSIKDILMLGMKDGNENTQMEKETLSIHEPTDELLMRTLRTSVDAEIVVDSDGSLPCEDQLMSETSNESIVLKYLLRIIYFAFWVTLYIIAIELQFGIVFLMFSALIGIYLNTRTGPKKINEISAYSVFNANCESIDGTLKAEQFEREIGIR